MSKDIAATSSNELRTDEDAPSSCLMALQDQTLADYNWSLQQDYIHGHETQHYINDKRQNFPQASMQVP